MAQKETVNTFTGGMVMDTHPLTTPNNVLTNCLNGTLVTFNGNEMILQNDLGNAKIKSEKNGDCVKLPEGFVPVGITEKGGIVYVASYNPKENKGLLGSFPSPETNFTSPEEGKEQSLDDDFLLDSSPEILIDNVTYKPLIKGSYKLDLSDIIIKTGDQYALSEVCEEGETPLDISDKNKGYTVKLIATTDRNEQVVISEDDDVLTQDPNEQINLVNYNDKAGKLSLLFTPEKPESFDVSYTIKNNLIIITCSEKAIVCIGNDNSLTTKVEEVETKVISFNEVATLTNSQFITDKFLQEVDNLEQLENILLYHITDNQYEQVEYSSEDENEYYKEIAPTLICKLYPVAKFNNSYVKEMEQTLHITIDPSKVGTASLSKWKYNVKDDRLLLQYGYNGQFDDTIQLTIKLTLVDYADVNPDENQEIDFTLNSIEYNLPTRESSIGAFYEYIYFENSTVDIPVKLRKNRLYAVKIEFTNEASEESNFTETKYRWLYTCPVFNDDYEEGKEEDFDNLYLKLKFKPEFNFNTEISANSTEQAYNTNLVYEEQTYKRLGITQNNYNVDKDITPTIELEDNYNLFTIDGQIPSTITGITKEDELKTTESTDYYLLVKNGKSTSEDLSDVYTLENGASKFKNNIDITLGNNTITISGEIYDKIYCQRNQRNFDYESVIAPLVYDNDSLKDYNLYYDGNSKHFQNSYFLVCKIDPANTPDTAGEIIIYKSKINGTYQSDENNDDFKGIIIEDIMNSKNDFGNNDTFTNSWVSDIVTGQTGINIQNVASYIGKNCSLIPIIFEAVPENWNWHSGEDEWDDLWIGREYSHNNIETIVQFVYNHPEDGTYSNPSNDNMLTYNIGKGIRGIYFATLMCKGEDQGKFIPMNMYKHIINDYQYISDVNQTTDLPLGATNQITNLNNYTFGDIIFNMLNQIYTQYTRGTDVYKRYGSGSSYVASDIQYILNNTGRINLEIKGTFDISDSTHIKINGKDLLTFSQLNNNNLLFNSKSQTESFNVNKELIFLIQNKLISTYEQLENPVTQRAYRFLSSTKEIGESDIVNLSDSTDINAIWSQYNAATITRELDGKFYLKGLTHNGLKNYVFDFKGYDGINVNFNLWYKTSRDTNNVFILPNFNVEQTEKKLLLRGDVLKENTTSLIIRHYYDHWMHLPSELVHRHNQYELALHLIANENLSFQLKNINDISVSLDYNIQDFAENRKITYENNKETNVLNNNISKQDLYNDIKINIVDIVGKQETLNSNNYLNIEFCSPLSFINSSTTYPHVIPWISYENNTLNEDGLYKISATINDVTSDELILIRDNDPQLIVTKSSDNVSIHATRLADEYEYNRQLGNSINVTFDEIYNLDDFHFDNIVTNSSTYNVNLRYWADNASSNIRLSSEDYSFTLDSNQITFEKDNLIKTIDLNKSSNYSYIGVYNLSELPTVLVNSDVITFKHQIKFLLVTLFASNTFYIYNGKVYYGDIDSTPIKVFDIQLNQEVDLNLDNLIEFYHFVDGNELLFEGSLFSESGLYLCKLNYSTGTTFSFNVSNSQQ